ncbi:MAG TPA: hypothetical protein VIG99_08900, partial [Myxococcaceae bacterium]
GRSDANDWSAYVPSNMRDYALAATEATKDAWTAFIRSMARPRASRETYARDEAQKLVSRWLSFDEAELRGWYSKPENRKATYVKATPQNQSEDSGKGTTVDQCMARDWKGTSQAAKILEHAQNRRTCLYNMLPAGDDGNVDASLHLAYDWKWRNKSQLETPTKDWQIDKPRLKTAQVKLANRVNQTYMRQESGYIYNDPVSNPTNVTFDVTYNPAIPLVQNSITFAINGESGKYLSRAGDSWGRVDIYSGDNKGHFSLERRADGYYAIKNIDDNVYMYMHTNNKTYVNKDGDPEKPSGQWRVDGLPEPYLVSGTYKAVFKDSTRTISANSGALLVGAGGAGSSWYFERQSDGSYKVRLPQSLVRSGAYAREQADHSLVAVPDAASANSFYLEEGQLLGEFTLRTADGRYWFSATPKVAGTPITTVETNACMWDPCQPAIAFQGAGGGAGGRNARAALPPGCTGVPKDCPMPQIFTISRDWAADDR